MKKNKNKKRDSKKEFSNSNLFDLSTSFFRQNPNKKLNYKQLSKALKIKSTRNRRQLVEVMKQMELTGILEEFQRGSYRFVKKRNVVFAKIKNTNSRGAYAKIDSENEIFIPKKNSSFVLTGDEVEIFVFTKKGGKKEAEVVTVIKRNKNEFVGVIESSSSGFFFIPDDRRVFFDVFLPPKSIKSEFLNKKVLVRVEGWDNDFKNPIGKVVKLIGDINNHDTEINSILFDYGFNTAFTKDVELDVKKIKLSISKKEIRQRLDVRKIKTFTIDPEDAKDFDDAISVKQLKNNNWEIGVHIADVSHYVLEGGVIDKEAFKRATSVYLVDRVIPMLPELLSNDLCSLKPNKDRLAYSVFFEFDEKYTIVDYKIAKTVIHSDFRFTYSSAQKTINTKKGVFAKELLVAEKISKKLRKIRFEKGSINFESSEVKFLLNKEKKPIDVYFKEVLQTNYLIEEFMLLTNKTVAKYMQPLKNKTNPFVYRIHDLPDVDKIKSLNGIVKKFGHTIDNKTPKNLSKSLNLLLKKVKGSAEQDLVEKLSVRSMAKAIYTTNNIGHFGLGFSYYTHFTSPIRRYPDLIVHRLLEKIIYNKKGVSKKELEKICKHCSEMEKVASQAERDSIKYMQVKFLQNKIGEIYDGVISGVTEWGVYVEIIKNKCEGLVKVSSIKDDHYFFDEKIHALVGYNSKKQYQIGKKVKIKIKKSNLEKRQMDFVLV